jgi:cysteine-rich repeat protein
MSQVRITFNVYDESNIATSFYFRPQLEGPFIPPTQENCAVEGDEDQDSYDNCVDPDCNGFIPGGLMPGICDQPIFTSLLGYTWNETTSSWENNIEFFCSYGPDWTNLDGYCCPTGTNWYGSFCSVEAPTPVCGDSNVDPGEDCDDGNTDNNDGCSSLCQTESATVCNNNNVIDLPGEYCDGSDLNNQTCDLQGYDSGNLDCDNCNFDFSNCVNDDPTSPGNTNPPIVGPDQYILNGDCVEDLNPDDEYGERTWIVYNQHGVLNSTGTVTCILDSEKIHFFGIYSMLVFVLVLVGFYSFRKKFK